jgi:HAD superfamily hydrolase (TIGR01549 family)
MLNVTQLPAVVLCDLDNTLYEYEPAHKAAMVAVRAKLHQTMSVKDDEFTHAFDTARKEVKEMLGKTAGAHSRLLYFKHMIEALGLKTQPLLSLDLEQTYWRTFLSAAKLLPGVKEFFEELHCLNIPRVLVTDLTTQIQLRKLIYFELENSFDVVVTSEEVGIEKPDARIFRYAMSKVSASGGPVWMIGDSIEKDMIGAKEALNAITFHRGGVFSRLNRPQSVDKVFKDFTDLLPFIRKTSSGEFEAANNAEDFNLKRALSSNK